MVAVRISSRSGLPSLLLYLGIGIAMGQDGIFDVKFDNAELTQVIGYAALVVILAEGGLGTKWKEVKPVLPAAAVLSTLGVGVSVGVTATAAHFLVGLDWRQALIIGAVVSSTDAAAVFSVLRRVPLPSRITGVLEAESGFNDAPVVILVVAFSAVGPVEHWYVLIGEIALELAIGAAIGLAVGWLGSYGIRHVALPASGLYPIAVMAIAVTAYAAGAMAHGSGFLAVYLAAMILGNSKLPHWPATRGFADGLGWLAQIGMFVLLGLLVTPHDLIDDFWPAVVVGLALTAVARPLSVFISLAPFRLPRREKALMSWAGLRGAVPIVLATIPMVSGVDGSTRVFNIVFVLVIVYTLIQGPTLPWLAKTLKISDDPSETSDLGIESAPWNDCAAICCPSRSPASPRCTTWRSRSCGCPPGPRSPSSSGTARASSRRRRPCCTAGTNCWSSRPIRCATRRRPGCGRSARAESWPAGWGRAGRTDRTTPWWRCRASRSWPESWARAARASPAARPTAARRLTDPRRPGGPVSGPRESAHNRRCSGSGTCKMKADLLIQ